MVCTDHSQLPDSMLNLVSTHHVVCMLYLPLCLRQAVIGNYAVPILEDKSVWGTNDDSRTAYMDTQVRALVLVCVGQLGSWAVCC